MYNPMGLNKKQLIEMRKTKLRKFDTNACISCLMFVPRHFLKVTVLVIVSSFFGMLYLINSDTDLE